MSIAATITAIQRDLESAQLLLDGVTSKLATLVRHGSGPVPKKRHWNQERNDIVVRDYPIGVPHETIAQRINALPGDKVTPRAVSIQAHRLGVGRPAGYSWGFARKTSDFGSQRGDGSAVNPPVKATPAGALNQHEAPAKAPANAATTPAPDGASVVGRPSVSGNPPTPSRMDIIRQVSATMQAGPRPAPIPSAPMPRKISMDSEQLFRWASQRGVSLQLPIDEHAVERVNAKALAIGHPPIEFVRSARARLAQ